jgi:hypothetical protein
LAPLRPAVGVEELAQEGAELGGIQVANKQDIWPACLVKKRQDKDQPTLA